MSIIISNGHPSSTNTLECILDIKTYRRKSIGKCEIFWVGGGPKYFVLSTPRCHLLTPTELRYLRYLRPHLYSTIQIKQQVKLGDKQARIEKTILCGSSISLWSVVTRWHSSSSSHTQLLEESFAIVNMLEISKLSLMIVVSLITITPLIRTNHQRNYMPLTFHRWNFPEPRFWNISIAKREPEVFSMGSDTWHHVTTWLLLSLYIYISQNVFTASMSGFITL